MESIIQESIKYLGGSNNTSISNLFKEYNNKNLFGQSGNFSGVKRYSESDALLDYRRKGNRNIGPNVNLKFAKNIERSEEQKEFFKKKICITKKTELCKNWELFGDCYYKENCSFAHGESELRNKLFLKNSNNDKYKTKPCRSFLEKSYCPFGNRCQYTHVVSQNRLLKYKALNLKLAQGILIEALKKENEQVDFNKLIENINTGVNFKM